MSLPPLSNATITSRTRLALGVLAVLTVLRTMPYLVFGPVHFDSDQAVLGLMAIDLSHIDTIPIVMYGQTYLLPVIAWLAAPLFAIAGPSIALLKAPFVVVNIAVVWTMYAATRRSLRLERIDAWLVAATLAIPTVVAAHMFMNASGGHVEPMLYVLLLFLLRDRPIALALVSAFAIAHRETVAVALIALAAVDALRIENARRWFRKWTQVAAIGLVALAAIHGAAAAWSTNYGGLDVSFRVTRDPLGNLYWLGRHTGALLGLRPIELTTVGFVLPHPEGSRLTGVAIGLLILAVIVALVKRSRGDRDRSGPRLDFAWYLLLTCLLTAVAFTVRRMDHDELQYRYVLLLLFCPGALAAIALAPSSGRGSRFVARASLCWIIAASAFSTATYLAELRGARVPDRLGDLARVLEGRNLRYGIAPYWTAYNLSFRSGGHIHTASSELVRIPHYQDEYDAHPGERFRIGGGPCAPGRTMVVRGIEVCME